MTGNSLAPGGGRRHAVLQAIGITPWVLRRPPVPPEAAGVAESPPLDAGAIAQPLPASRCVVLLPADAQGRALDLLGRALVASGAEIARAGRIRVASGQLDAAVPHAPVYLVLGQAQAHALGRELPAAVMSAAHIALADEPDRLLAEPASKRRLWAALRQARRALAAAKER